MINVLIAEDELPLLRGIKKLIEKTNPTFRVEAMAKNGKEAIELLKTIDVDVVFTDMNMPLVEGSEVLDYIQQNKPGVRSVVISGYDEFSYVKDAMKYNAKDYILKPIDTQELAQLLTKLEEEIEKSRYSHKKKELQQALIKGKLEQEEPKITKTTYMLYFCAGAFPITVCDEGGPGEAYWEAVDLQAFLENCVPNSGLIWTFGGRNLSEKIAIIEMCDETLIDQVMDQIMHHLPQDLPLTVALSDKIDSVHTIKKKAFVLRDRIRNHGIFGQTKILKGDRSNPYQLDNHMVEPLKFAIKKREYPIFKDMIHLVKEELEKKAVRQKDLEEVLRYILLLMQTEFESYDVHMIDLSVDELITNNWDYEHLFSDFLVICEEFYSGGFVVSESHEALMEAVDDYIRENISKRLSTKALSAKFGLVAPYLSKLFKDYKGVSPSQYIQNIRLESAEKLLADCPNMLIKDISEMVGYNDSLYFSKVFKKHYGVYPSKYRAISNEEEDF